MSEMKFVADPSRVEEFGDDPTGMYVRALNPVTGKYYNADISHLDAASLLSWLKSRGGDNVWAEDVVGILLGHGRLHEGEQDG